MKTCDYCGRENANDVAYCPGCGTSLLPEGASQSSPQPRPTATRARIATTPEKQMLYGGLWFVGGILVTAITYQAASSSRGGGTYVVAWGAIVFGAIRFFKGFFARNLTPTPRVEESGYEALSLANRLETQGRVEEAIAAYQKIIEMHPNTGAGNDAQKSLENLIARRG